MQMIRHFDPPAMPPVALLVATIIFALLFGNGCAQRQIDTEQQKFTASLPYEKWGIEVLQIRLSAKGHMLDFRYRVKDAVKAQPLFSSKIKPYLVDEKTGNKHAVPQFPKIGALRQTSEKPMLGRNYFIFFSNPGRQLQTGSRVTVVMGDFMAEHLVVQ